MTISMDVNKIIAQYLSTRHDLLAFRSVNRKLRDDLDFFADEILKIIQTQESPFPRNLLPRISRPYLPLSSFGTLYKICKIASKKEPSLIDMNLESLRKCYKDEETSALNGLNSLFAGHPALRANPNSLDAACIALLKDPLLADLSFIESIIRLERTEVMKAFIASPHFQGVSADRLAAFCEKAVDNDSAGCLSLLCDAIAATPNNYNNPNIIAAFETALKSAKRHRYVHCIDILTPHIQRKLLKKCLLAPAACIASIILSTSINRLIFPSRWAPIYLFGVAICMSALTKSLDILPGFLGSRFPQVKITAIDEQGRSTETFENINPPPSTYILLGFYYLAQIGLAASTKFLERKIPGNIYASLGFTSFAAAALAKFNNPYLNTLVIAVGSVWVRRKRLFGRW